MQFIEHETMPAKKKPAHNTHSVTGARASSPLTIKLKNNLAATKKKPALKSVVKVVNNDKQNKKKRVSFHEDVPAQPADITPPRQTAFADAMEKWKQSVICAVKSMPSPSVQSSTDSSAQAAAQNNNLLKQVVGKGNSRNQVVYARLNSFHAASVQLYMIYSIIKVCRTGRWKKVITFEVFLQLIILPVLPELYQSKINSAKKDTSNSN